MDSKRSSFTGKIGFVLAAAGSAVGLGNIWRFPYLAAQYGGGIFLLVYILLAVTFGFALMIAEVAIGRKTGMSPIEAYRKLDKRFTFVGWISALIPAIILPYYSVIGGWVTKYMAGYVVGDGRAMAGENFFGGFIGSTAEPLAWFFVFVAITAVIVLLGVQKGIEKVSKFMMPVLIVLILGISIYSIATMDRSWDGVVYYLKPDFSKFSVKTVVAAMGQLFYSMSLAMGIMITFGSYMKKDISIEKSTRQIEVFDTVVAFLAGLMIIPAVFSYANGNEAIMSSKGPGLMFDVLPKIFGGMTGGSIIGFAFFLMVFFAALTSSISLMETVVSVIQDKTKLSRKKASLLVFVFSIVLGAISSLGYSLFDTFTLLGMQMLDFFDFISNSIMMPVAAFFTCVCVGFIVKPKWVCDEVELNGKFAGKKLFNVMIKYIAPVFILIILISSVLSAFGIFTL